MESLQQLQVPYISHEDRASWLDDSHRSFEHVQEIVETRKILYYSVEDYRIESPWTPARKVIGRLLLQGHVSEPLLHQRLLQFMQDDWRDIGAIIAAAVGGDAK